MDGWGNQGRSGRTLTAALAVAALAAAGLAPAEALAQSADLSVTKTDSADPAITGAELTYTIGVTNSGPNSATGVTLDDELPNQVDFLAASASSIYAESTCTLQGSRNVRCPLGTIPSTGTATITIRVRTKRAGTIVNTAAVSASTSDPQSGNNSDTEQTVVQDPSGGATCAGKPATITGTAGPETLEGTNKRDVIAAGGGDDLVRGLDGKDIICGGAGFDRIRGQRGGDVLRGGSGNDRLRGGPGDDRIAGNGGDDRLAGGAGDDLLRGGRGNDTCRGGPGTDIRRRC